MRLYSKDGTCHVCTYVTCGEGEDPVGWCPQGSSVDKTSCVKTQYTMGHAMGMTSDEG